MSACPKMLTLIRIAQGSALGDVFAILRVEVLA